MVAHLSPRAPMNAALHSSQGPTAKSLEWSCAARRGDVCIRLGCDPNLTEFSRNLPATAERLGSGLQRLSVYISACKHESTCPKEHFALSCLLPSISHTEIPFDERPNYLFAADVIYFSAAVLSLDISGTYQECCCHVFKASWSSFLLSFPPVITFSVNQGVYADEISLIHPHAY